VAEFTEVIPPGQEGEITLEVVGEKVSGNLRKNATVTSNDPKHPQMTITIAGKIIPHVQVEPSNRIYLRGMYGESVMRELTISSNEKKKDFEIYSVTSNIDDKITYRVVPDAEPGRYTVKLFKNPKLPTLNTWGSITIHSNSELSKEKVVQVNVTTRGAIVVQPSTLNFGALSVNTTGAGPEKSLTVFKLKGDFHIMDVAFSSDHYVANVEPIEDGKKYKVTVNFRPSEDKKSYVDEMIINTDDPQEPSLRVRLLARGM
jgi:hypothetical protein